MPRAATSRKRAARPPRLVVVRTHEVTGSSRRGWEGAIRDAIKTARDTTGHDVVGLEVVRLQGEVASGKLRRYRATVKVAYRQPVR